MSWDCAGEVFNYSDRVCPEKKKSRILVVIIYKLLWKHVAQKVRGVLKQGEKTPLLLSKYRSEEQSNQLNVCIIRVASQLQLRDIFSHLQKN